MAESKRFLLRLDPDLFEALRRWADDDLRSINAQIEYLLTDQARRAGRLPGRRPRTPLPPEDESNQALAELTENELTENEPRKRGSRSTRTSA
jgi:hypothetical protein